MKFISRSALITRLWCGNRDAAINASAVGGSLCGAGMGCGVGESRMVVAVHVSCRRPDGKSEEFSVDVFFGGRGESFSWSARRFHKMILAASPRKSLMIWASRSSRELSASSSPRRMSAWNFNFGTMDYFSCHETNEIRALAEPSAFGTRTSQSTIHAHSLRYSIEK